MIQDDMWMDRVMKVYGRMKEKGEYGIYGVVCNGISLQVHPNVYSPVEFSDSAWFATELPKIVEQNSLLEIGTGTGIVGISCALAGAKVVASDVNSDAVLIAKENVSHHSLRIDVRQGDVYSALQPDERFDYIFWSHPYNNWPTPVDNMLLQSGLDYNYESLKKYIKGAKDHLTPKGKLLLGTGNTADVETILKIADENGYVIQILSMSTMPLAKNGDVCITNMIVQFVKNEK